MGYGSGFRLSRSTLRHFSSRGRGKGSARVIQEYEEKVKDCFDKRDIDGVDGLFVEMRGAGVRFRPQTFTILISGFAGARMADKAKQMFDSMGEAGVERNVIHYNAMMNAYAKRGRIAEAEKLLSEMRKAKVMPDV